jgi:nitrogen fixation/metabolism regulation signal transduction histidine kinase
MEINVLSEVLRRQRVGSLEIAALLNRVVDAIDVAVFTFDSAQRLRLVNRAGERLLAHGSERLLGRTAEELGLTRYLTDSPAQIVDASFPAGPGRWDIRERVFREAGRAHRLLLISDLSRPLREEERQAWMRLIRVLGHEINNSLAPVISISASLATLLSRPELPEDWLEDAQLGLRVISSRAESLNRFMGSYTRLARMPRPTFRSFEIGPWIERIARLEVRLPVTVQPGRR